MKANDCQSTIKAENPCAPNPGIISNGIQYGKSCKPTTAIIFEINERYPSRLINRRIVGKMQRYFMTEAWR
jgi:hypothetical protein